MARGRRGRRRTDAREQRSNRDNRPRRIFPLAVSLAAVPVGMVVAGALLVTGVGDELNPFQNASNGEAAEGEIGDPLTDAPPDAETNEDFFQDPTGAPDDSTPSSESGPQDAQVTASSAPEDQDDDEGSDSGGSDGSDGSGGSGGSGNAQADEVVQLVNDERADHGCDPVTIDDRLTSAAQEHSEDMNDRDYMSHESPDDEGPAERAQRHGYNAFGAENVAKGQSSAEQVMQSWMDSDGHRDNILNCDLESIGVGEADNAWTQKFGWE